MTRNNHHAQCSYLAERTDYTHPFLFQWTEIEMLTRTCGNSVPRYCSGHSLRFWIRLPGFESWVGPKYYKASITAQDLPANLHPFRVVHRVSEQLNFKAVTGACKLIDGYSLVMCSVTTSVASSGICHINKVNSIARLYRDGFAMR